MKKLVCYLLALVLCFSLASSVFANDFVPSIGEKGAPRVRMIQGPDGEPAVGVIEDEAGNPVGYAAEKCLVVTPVSQANTSTEIPEDARATLLSVYAALSDGTMTLPYEKFGSSLDADKMTIRDLFDASILCEDHPAMLEPAGVTFEITFELGVGKYDEVYTMTYNDGVWNPIVSTTNNGDGSVTCVFEHLCPVAFSVYTGTGTPSPDTGDNANTTLWIALLAAAAVALVVITVAYSRKKVQNA